MAVTDFFSRFQEFVPNHSAPAKDEFTRLAHQRGWKVDGKTYRKHWATFTASEFARHYGREETKLENWQNLCREVRVEGDISSITKCRKALHHAHVNIIDLIDARRTGTRVGKFPNVHALRDYTITMGKIFPKKAAKSEGFLKALLRGIF